MELQFSQSFDGQEKFMQDHEKAFSCSLSNRCTFAHCSVENTEKSQKSPPFEVIKNYRQNNRNSNKIQKKTKSKIRRKMSESREVQQISEMKKIRKMTASVQIDDILEENQDQEIGSKRLYEQERKDAMISSEVENELIWENPELEKMIPIDFNGQDINFQSPLNFSGFQL